MDQRVIIARLNIEHYRRKLAAEKGETTRQTIIRLLADEEAKLAALNDPSDSTPPRRPTKTMNTANKRTTPRLLRTVRKLTVTARHGFALRSLGLA